MVILSIIVPFLFLFFIPYIIYNIKNKIKYYYYNLKNILFYLINIIIFVFNIIIIIFLLLFVLYTLSLVYCYFFVDFSDSLVFGVMPQQSPEVEAKELVRMIVATKNALRPFNGSSFLNLRYGSYRFLEGRLHLDSNLENMRQRLLTLNHRYPELVNSNTIEGYLEAFNNM